MTSAIIIRQILILATIVVIGLIACRAKVITAGTRDFLAKLIFYVTLPSMLFTSFSTIEVTPRLLANSLQALLLAAIIMLFMLFAGWLATLVYRIRDGHASIFRLHSMLGNIIYLGLPVISAQFGQEGLLYGSIFVLVSNILMWTAGVAIISPGKGFSLKTGLGKIFNINTIAIITGFLLFLLQIKLPKFILDTVGALGKTNTYLSMIFIAAVIYFADGRKMLGNRNAYLLSFNRLLLVPYVLLGLFILFSHLFPGILQKEVVSVMLMQAAMPCMVNVVIMVNILGEDDGTATANVFISTILSIITLPLILLSLNLL
ncbi:MAG: AEC family transporter [Actinomycetota bacterium]